MKSIALRLWLWIMALVALVLALLWLFQIAFLESFYTGMRMADLQRQSTAILSTLESGDPSYQGMLNELVYGSNGSAELVDIQGKQLYFAGGTERNTMPLADNIQTISALARVTGGERVMVTITHPRFKNEYALIGLPWVQDGRQAGALVLMFPLAAVKETAQILKQQLVYITAILTAASVVAAFFLSRSFTRPIRNITRVSRQMAAGDFSSRVETKRKDELGGLATTLNEMGRELSQLEGLRRDLIANVSHELRTPLSLIKGYAETLRDVTGSDRAKREAQLGIIMEEADRLDTIVNDILNLSQIQSGKAVLDITAFDLCALLHGVTQSYGILSEKTGVELALDCPGAAAVKGDEARIRQVLYNLLANAFNHTPAGGRVCVRVLHGNTAERVEVADTGEGIPEDELKYIWDRFYKASLPDKKRRAGSGLGLSLVKGILDAHGSGYGVASKAGEGTTFWFELQHA